MHPPISDVISAIITRNQRIRDFWSRAHGWAPYEAADLLSKSRLDWQVGLSHTLRLWLPEPADLSQEDSEGRLILAWANLGSLVEGTLKWFLSVYYSDYKVDINAITSDGVVQDPDGAKFDRLRQFFQKVIWTPEENYDQWILRIQQRRNALHAYKAREIGTFEELEDDVRTYLPLLECLDGRVPYPD